MTVSSYLNFGRPAPSGRGSAVGRKIFGSTLLQPARSVCDSSQRFVIVVICYHAAFGGGRTLVEVCVLLSVILVYQSTGTTDFLGDVRLDKAPEVTGYNFRELTKST